MCVILSFTFHMAYLMLGKLLLGKRKKRKLLIVLADDAGLLYDQGTIKLGRIRTTSSGACPIAC